MTDSSELENAPSQCTESSKSESVIHIRPTEETMDTEETIDTAEESNHTDEDNNILKSGSKSDIDRNEILGKSLSNITKKIHQCNLDKSDLALLQMLEDILKEVNNMNKALENCDNAARLKAMESHVKRETETKKTSEKVKRVIKERKHQSEILSSTQPHDDEKNLVRCNTHPITHKEQPIKVNVEVHIGSDDQEARKCDNCDRKVKPKESVENVDIDTKL